ncbi:c-type cytochrome [Paenibacillus sp. 1P07SE]|uniref:c-type cytochrome n=1 Tax=Paenibacillus sp. 1P07SE TaxID=3132209 RepID=UPI0039A678A0
MNKWKGMLATAALAAMLAASGCGGGGTETPEGVNTGAGEEASEYSEAMSLYRSKCLSCHGAELKGRTAPNLQQVGAKYEREEIVSIIADGRGGMPAFGRQLSEEEVGTLADWLAVQQ